MQHELKIWPQYFQAVTEGSKTFEIRKNDRGFQKGDTVVLKEFIESSNISVPSGYTGKKAVFNVGYVTPIDMERVVFSLLPINIRS